MLKQPALGIHDNFFELGGHSLLATQLVSRLRDALGMTVAVRWLFEAPSVAELAGLLRSTEQDSAGSAPIPANRILPGAPITPDLLPLVRLTQAEIDHIGGGVDGGVDNVQDIYPLAPLQEGILFHHRLQETGDAYLLHVLLAFDTLARSEAFLAAMQAVIDRHDILRTAVVWEQLSEPMQVVWRQAKLPVEIRRFDPAQGPVAEQLVESLPPAAHAPEPEPGSVAARGAGRGWGPLAVAVTVSPSGDGSHHAGGHARRDRGAPAGDPASRCLPAVPFRNFVAQARGGLSPAEHEAFFRDMLGTMETPTLPFGLVDVRGDGSRIGEASWNCHGIWRCGYGARAGVWGRRRRDCVIWHGRWCCRAAAIRTTWSSGRYCLAGCRAGEGVERALGMFINTLAGAHPV